MKVIYTPRKQTADLSDVLVADGIEQAAAWRIAKRLNGLNGEQSNFDAVVVEENHPLLRGSADL